MTTTAPSPDGVVRPCFAPPDGRYMQWLVGRCAGKLACHGCLLGRAPCPQLPRARVQRARSGRTRTIEKRAALGAPELGRGWTAREAISSRSDSWRHGYERASEGMGAIQAVGSRAPLLPLPSPAWRASCRQAARTVARSHKRTHCHRRAGRERARRPGGPSAPGARAVPSLARRNAAQVGQSERDGAGRADRCCCCCSSRAARPPPSPNKRTNESEHESERQRTLAPKTFAGSNQMRPSKHKSHWQDFNTFGCFCLLFLFHISQLPQ